MLVTEMSCILILAFMLCPACGEECNPVTQDIIAISGENVVSKYTLKHKTRFHHVQWEDNTRWIASCYIHCFGREGVPQHYTFTMTNVSADETRYAMDIVGANPRDSGVYLLKMGKEWSCTLIVFNITVSEDKSTSDTQTIDWLAKETESDGASVTITNTFQTYTITRLSTQDLLTQNTSALSYDISSPYASTKYSTLQTSGSNQHDGIKHIIILVFLTCSITLISIIAAWIYFCKKHCRRKYQTTPLIFMNQLVSTGSRSNRDAIDIVSSLSQPPSQVQGETALCQPGKTSQNNPQITERVVTEITRDSRDSNELANETCSKIDIKGRVSNKDESDMKNQTLAELVLLMSDDATHRGHCNTTSVIDAGENIYCSINDDYNDCYAFIPTTMSTINSPTNLSNSKAAHNTDKRITVTGEQAMQQSSSHQDCNERLGSHRQVATTQSAYGHHFEHGGVAPGPVSYFYNGQVHLSSQSYVSESAVEHGKNNLPSTSNYSMSNEKPSSFHTSSDEEQSERYNDVGLNALYAKPDKSLRASQRMSSLHISSASVSPDVYSLDSPSLEQYGLTKNDEETHEERDNSPSLSMSQSYTLPDQPNERGNSDFDEPDSLPNISAATDERNDSLTPSTELASSHGNRAESIGSAGESEVRGRPNRINRNTFILESSSTMNDGLLVYDMPRCGSESNSDGDDLAMDDLFDSSEYAVLNSLHRM